MYLEPVLHSRRSHLNEKPMHCTEKYPHSPQLENARAATRLSTAKNKYLFFFSKKGVPEGSEAMDQGCQAIAQPAPVGVGGVERCRGSPGCSYLSDEVLEATPWDPRVMLLEGFCQVCVQNFHAYLKRGGTGLGIHKPTASQALTVF